MFGSLSHKVDSESEKRSYRASHLSDLQKAKLIVKAAGWLRRDVTELAKMGVFQTPQNIKFATIQVSKMELF
jgi:hypothetical protein